MLLPDMLFELPAGVVCAKAGAATNPAAKMAATAAVQIAFMVVSSDDRRRCAPDKGSSPGGAKALQARSRPM
ncbi:MAG: hypothetical protein WBQ17_13415 [Rhizomicrobium sp.]